MLGRLLISLHNESVLLAGLYVLLGQFPKTFVKKVSQVLVNLVHHQKSCLDLLTIFTNKLFYQAELLGDCPNLICLDLKLHYPLGHCFKHLMATLLSHIYRICVIHPNPMHQLLVQSQLLNLLRKTL